LLTAKLDVIELGNIKSAIALFDAPADRSFEPQIHADGRGWGKGRTFEPQIHADGRGWGKGRSLFY